jgi:UDP-N-acetylglucosamine 4,6-dehydratase/5-epimerase
MKNEKIFITGGAGFLGRSIIQKFYENNEITVYSRDEAKHYYLQKQFPKVNFVVGDVRNRDLLLRKSRGHTIGIFAASLKQIDACTDNYEEAKSIIIDGAINSRIVAEDNNFKSACFISSDKSRSATTIYGAMKYVAGDCFITGESDCNLTTVIYGNVNNSTGSLIPLIWNNIKNNKKISLYGIDMTRFLLDVDVAVNLIETALTYKKCNVIPEVASFRVSDLLQIYKKEFGLEYDVSTPRTGEKIHEIMLSSEEIRRTEYIEKDKVYLLHPKKEFKNTITFPNSEYSSRDYCMNINDLYVYLKNRNFYNY